MTGFFPLLFVCVSERRHALLNVDIYIEERAKVEGQKKKKKKKRGRILD